MTAWDVIQGAHEDGRVQGRVEKVAAGVGEKLSGDLKLYKWMHINSVCSHSLSPSVFRFLLVVSSSLSCPL